jgi:hypothetical protein
VFLRYLGWAENPVAEVEDYKVRCKRRIPTVRLHIPLTS